MIFNIYLPEGTTVYYQGEYNSHEQSYQQGSSYDQQQCACYSQDSSQYSHGGGSGRGSSSRGNYYSQGGGSGRSSQGGYHPYSQGGGGGGRRGSSSQGGSRQSSRYNYEPPAFRPTHATDPASLGWIYTGQNTQSRVEYYTRPDGAKIDYYPTTGTIKTSLNHPTQGPTQMFRRGLSEAEITRVLENPRAHTNKGYQRRRHYD